MRLRPARSRRKPSVRRQLADTSVTPGVFTLATITVDQQGRITAASSGTAGEVNTGANVGTDGVGVFAGKLGTELRFRHIAPASNRISVTLDGRTSMSTSSRAICKSLPAT